MTATEQALADMWRSRDKQKLPYLLVNDVRGYFAEAPSELWVDGQQILVHVCANEFSLRRHTEHERQKATPPARIIISRQQLQPDHLPDLQVRSSVSSRTVTGCDIAKALGVQNPGHCWTGYYTSVLEPGSVPTAARRLQPRARGSRLIAERPSVLSAGWEPDRVLDKLWYEDALTRYARF